MEPPSTRVTLNVGGVHFLTTTDTLKVFPDTRLGRMATDHSVTCRREVELFFDRSPDMVNSLLDLYRTGELHVPEHVCTRTVQRELEFWEVPEELIRECCYKAVRQHREGATIIAEIDKFLTVPYDSPEETGTLSSWNRIWLTMERPGDSLASKAWSATFFGFVLLSVLLDMLQTNMKFRDFRPHFLHALARANSSLEQALPHLTLDAQYGTSEPKPWLLRAELVVFAFFLLEFVARVLTCPARRSCMLREVKSWFDLFMIVQTALALALERLLEGKKVYSSAELNALNFFYSMTMLRVFRIVYLAKRFDAMKILLLSTRASLKVLLMLIVCLLCLATVFGAAVFLAELLSEHHAFHSIPYSLWYAVVTITTVGYGDVVPESTAGRLLGVLCALCGVVVMALPVTVIASKFGSYHDNITSRGQMKTRLRFLRDNSRFCSDCRSPAATSTTGVITSDEDSSI